MSEATPEQVRDLLNRSSGRRTTHLPFKSTYAGPVSPTKVGGIMDELHSGWHVVQFLGFRFVIMWRGRP